MSIFFHEQTFFGFIKRCPVSSFLIFCNTIIFIITLVIGGFSPYNLFRLGGLLPPAVFAGEYYRLFMVMFIHGSISHFLFNTLFGIMIIGAGLEKLIGSFKYFFVYFLSGLISSVVILFFSTGLTVGASGAIYGVLGTFIYIIIYQQHLVSFSDRVYIRNLLIINLVFTFLVPRISIYGHLGGLAAGFGLGLILLNSRKQNYYN